MTGTDTQKFIDYYERSERPPERMHKLYLAALVASLEALANEPHRTPHDTLRIIRHARQIYHRLQRCADAGSPWLKKGRRAYLRAWIPFL